MNEHDEEQHDYTPHPKATETDALLEAHITRILHEQAEKVHFSPALRQHILERLPARRPASTRRSLVLAATLVAACVLLLACVASIMIALQPPHPPGVATVTTYVVEKTFNTPKELATEGQPMLVDPTGQHLVYGLAKQPGVMYTTDLANPVAHNLLAMQNARDIAWANDGSALVTTIAPSGTTIPLLALVPVGKYMHLPGKEALAASWLPTSTQHITYITQSADNTLLWDITPDGKANTLTGTMHIPLLVQRLSWSPNGQQLAILATNAHAPSQQALQQPTRAIYLLDARSHSVQEIIPVGDFSLGTLAWSSDAHYMTYERIDGQGHTTLHTLDMTNDREVFTLALQHNLMGLSWSPNSRSLVYSDGGTLLAHTVSGPALLFPRIASTGAMYPSWLDSTHMLYMQISNGVGQLTLLAQR